MESLKLFAPCDGEVKKLKDLKDGAFSEGMLGDGFFIKPSSSEFYSVLEQGNVSMIFDTKHAVSFKHKHFEILMHIGIDTVNLKGEPFQYSVKVGDQIQLKTKILDVDLEKIKDKKISTDTPIVVQGENYKIKNLKTGKVKAGDLICEVVFEVSKEIKKVDTRSKQEVTATEILNLVGTEANIASYYNCMTRLRIQVRDKNLIKEDQIKKITMVKGTNWIGDEFQIIIGPDVFKVKNKLEEAINNNGGIESKGQTKPIRKYKTKLSFFVFVNGVVAPLLPIIVAAGLLIGFKSICELAGWIEPVGLNYSMSDVSTLITQYNLFTAIVFMLSQIGIGFVGMFFCISTVKFLKGNVVIAAFIALTIASPIMFGGLEFKLFSIGDVNISVKAYAYSILPQIAAGFLYVYLDRWISKWIPSNLDLILRCLINYVVVVLFVWFFIGPIFGLVESGAYYLISLLAKVPYGFGVGVAGFLWMPLVLTGTHQAVATLITVGINNGTPSVTGAMMIVPTFAQLGASIAVYIKTKNIEVKRNVISGLVPGVCGVIEPLLYSTNLQKKGAFLSGCIGGAIGMVAAGLMNVQIDASGPLGVFSLTGAFGAGTVNAMLYVLVWLIALACGMGLCFVLYRERPSENKEIKKTNSKLLSFIKKNNFTVEESKLAVISKESDFVLSSEDLKTISSIDNKMLEILKIKDKIQIEDKKINQKQTSLGIKLNKMIDKNNPAEVKKIKDSIDSIPVTKLNSLNSELENAELELQKIINELEKLQDNKMASINLFLSDLEKEVKNEKIKEFKTKYFNAIHSVDINYKMTTKME